MSSANNEKTTRSRKRATSRASSPRSRRATALTLIYDAAGVTLEVDESDEVIPALTGDEDEPPKIVDLQ